MPFVPNTAENERQMLAALGLQSFEELLSEIPEEIRFRGDFDLPAPLSELEAYSLLREMAGENKNIYDYACFLGAGAYDHYVPAAIDHLLRRSEFYTAYTPYQPEVSQGTLQAIFEYQTMICELTGMDVANASLYDGGTALAEAVLLAYHKKRGCNHLLISEGINPHYMKIIETYCHGQGIELRRIPLTDNGTLDLDVLSRSVTNTTCGVVIQQPNFFGCLEDTMAIEPIVHGADSLFIVSVDPISLGLITPPGEYHADIVTGEGQVLGNALSFGGPYLGIFAVRKEHVRQMPGRLIGETVDSQGRRGFVMTLQTREQHIRREKATSNICTNQALNALAATIYLSLLGKQGIKEVAEQCLQRSHYLADGISNIKGFGLPYSAPFFKEFVVECPVPAKEVVSRLKNHNILAGVDLGRFDDRRAYQLLVAVTEKRSRKDLDRFISALQEEFA